MTLSLLIERADFGEPALADFLQQHLDDMRRTSPPESVHALDLGALQRPGIRLWVGRDERGSIVTSGALAPVSAGHEEIKSMRTAESVRGRGVARTMLAHLLDDARARGVRRLSLETGSQAFFAPAHALYRSAGFMDAGPFGSYTDDPNSRYLTLELSNAVQDLPK